MGAEKGRGSQESASPSEFWKTIQMKKIYINTKILNYVFKEIILPLLNTLTRFK
jgi:hypothetical protein